MRLLMILSFLPMLAKWDLDAAGRAKIPTADIICKGCYLVSAKQAQLPLAGTQFARHRLPVNVSGACRAAP